jgi:cyclophilin family peptidyl-prolyl cis-trans isomerase
VTRILIPLVAAVTLVLLVVWLQQSNAPSATAPAGATSPARGDAAQGGAPAEPAATAGDRTAEAAGEDDASLAEPAGEAAAAEVASEAATAESAEATSETPATGDAEGPAAPEAGAVLLVPEGFTAVAPLVAERRLAFEEPDDVLDPGLDYAAVIETNRGAIVVDLHETQTPVTVNSFVFLALHRYFDGIVFHRVIDGFMAQTGDPTGTGTGGPGYRFADEIVEDLRHDGPGVLSMANSGPGTNGSQFFLTFDATPWLDNAHTVFGRVVDGLEVLDAITRVDPQQPSVVAILSDPAATVRDQGVDLAGDGSVVEALTAALGVTPVPGPGYEIGGARVIIGTVGGDPAAGFFPTPDRMERVTIVARPRE